MTSSLDEQEAQILRSWQINASPWSRAIRTGGIASRKLVTNAAILAALDSLTAADGAALRVLDLGCGEGWLARELGARGMQVLGIDVIPELIAEAQKLGGGEFQILDYAAIASRQWCAGPFDVAVCNFSLLGKQSVESLVSALPHYLGDSGHLIIQTLHPVAACGAEPYQDGWRGGNWCGFSSDFSDPSPWYFRTIESWISLLVRCGFEVSECLEPKAAEAAAPASIIWICNPRGAAHT